MVELVQIKYDGVFHEIPVNLLDLNPSDPSDVDVRTAVEHHLEVDSLSEYVLEPPENDEARPSATVLVMRPVASHGNSQ